VLESLENAGVKKLDSVNCVNTSRGICVGVGWFGVRHTFCNFVTVCHTYLVTVCHTYLVSVRRGDANPHLTHTGARLVPRYATSRTFHTSRVSNQRKRFVWLAMQHLTHDNYDYHE
jgi:hypothetical protein